MRPKGWDEALALKAARPDAVPVAGGTDVMVDLNFDRCRPAALLDLSLVPEITGWATTGDRVRLGAGISYTELTGERVAPGVLGHDMTLADLLPGLAQAARTVASPQIRNRATIGGNLGSASPAGDCHPPLLASGAEVEVASVRGTRLIGIGDFFTGVKANALRPDELIAAIWVTRASGPQYFAKVGARNAMVIAVVAFALALRPDSRSAGTGIGAAGPTPLRALEAERFLAAELDGSGLWRSRAPLPEPVVTQFAGLVCAAARPIDDMRGTAAYRQHALAVLASRTLTWAWHDYRQGFRTPLKGQEAPCE